MTPDSVLAELMDELAKERDACDVLRSDLLAAQEDNAKLETKLEDARGERDDAQKELADTAEELADLREQVEKFMFDILGTHNPTIVDFTAKSIRPDTELLRVLM